VATTERAPTAKPKLVRSLRSGQITVPIEFRRELGIGADTMLQARVEDGELRLRPVAMGRTSTADTWFQDLYDDFAPVRQEAIAKGYTEDEINGWIDEAVREVRAERAARAQRD